MCKVEAICTIGVQLQESWSNNVVIQIYSLAADVAFSLQYEAALVRNDQVVFDEVAVEDVPTIGKECKPARHVSRLANGGADATGYGSLDRLGQSGRKLMTDWTGLARCRGVFVR